MPAPGELGFPDTGAMWRSGYDMTPEQFAALTEKIWQEVKPLYDSLHCYTRNKLNEKYGDAVQAKTGPIRADLLGNMWAQEWGNIYNIVAPKGAGDLGYDIGDLLTAKGYDPLKMVKAGENFYSSLGFKPLPETFWTRSADHQAARPRRRLPCLGLGHRHQGRCPHQDVHEGQQRRLRDHPSRAGPQLLSARLSEAGFPPPGRRQ